MAFFDSLRSPKSDRNGRGCEANYQNRLRNRNAYQLHVDGDGFIDGHMKGNKFIPQIPSVRYGLGHLSLLEWIQYDNADGIVRPVVMADCPYAIDFRYSAEYYENLQRNARGEEDYDA